MQTFRMGIGAVSVLCTVAVADTGRPIVDIGPVEGTTFFERFDPGVDSSTLPLYGLRLDSGTGQGIFDTLSLVIDAPVLARRERVCVAVHSIDGWFEAVNVYQRARGTPVSERWRLGSLTYGHTDQIADLGPDRLFAVVSTDESDDEVDPCAVERVLHVPVVDPDDPDWTQLSVAVNTSDRTISATLSTEGDESVVNGRCAPAAGIDEHGALIDTVCRFDVSGTPTGIVTLQVSFGAGAFSDDPDPVRITLPARG